MRRRLLAAFLLLGACKRPAPPGVAASPWAWESPRPQGNTLHAVYLRGESFWAVGDHGTIVVKDGAGLALASSGTTAALHGVTGDGGGVVAVGDGGTILASSDGRTFQAMTSPTTANLLAVWATGHGRIFAAGAGGTILRSTDGGATWTPVISGVTATLRAIAGTVHDEIFAAGDGGTLLVAEDNAPVWTRREAGTNADLLSIAVEPKGDVVVAGGDALLRSSDRGKTWKLGEAPDHGLLAVVAAPEGDGGLLAGGAGGLYLARGGPSFVRVEGTGTLLAGAASGKTAVFVGPFGTILSRTGDALTDHRVGPRARLTAVAVCGGKVYVAGTDGTALTRSPGGAFTPLATDHRGELSAVACEGDLAVFAGSGGALLRRSGERLVTEPSGSERLLTGIALAGGRLFAVADDGSVLEDGARVVPPGAPLRAISGDGRFAVGDRGTILLRGDDGWTPVRAAGVTADLRAVTVAGKSDVYAVGRGGAILRSKDGGASWAAEASPTTADLAAVASDGTDVLVAGERGLLLRSHAGGPFAVEDSGTVNDLSGAAFAIGAGNARPQLVVGAGGTILAR